MNTKLIVKVFNDANHIPIKYSVIDIKPRVYPVATTADVVCILQVVQVGWNTLENYTAWRNYRKTTGIQGTLGTISTNTLNNLRVYQAMTPGTDV